MCVCCIVEPYTDIILCMFRWEKIQSLSTDFETMSPIQRNLQLIVSNAGMFVPMRLMEHDFYQGVTSMQRHRFVERLQLAFPIDVLKYSPGGNTGNVVIIWKAPENCTDAVRMAISLQSQLPEYHTRQQRLNFSKSFGNLAKVSPAVRRAIYSELSGSGDFSASPNPEMDARARLVLLGESPELIYDLRRLNTGRVPSFEVFFSKMGEALEDWVAADD